MIAVCRENGRCDYDAQEMEVKYAMWGEGSERIEAPEGRHNCTMEWQR